MGEKLKKYAIIIFLTFLVWAWAFNELEKTETRTATLSISKNPDSDIFVTFDRPTPIEMNIEFKGTPDKINNLINRIEAGLEDLKFDYSPKNKNRPSPFPLNVVDFLNDSSKVRELELKVISSSVEVVQVNIEKLVKKELKINCIDEKGAEIVAETISPSLVDIYTRKGYTGNATVVLTERDIIAARKDYVIRHPFVELSPTERRIGQPVEIRLPPVELPSREIQITRIGYSFTESLMGKYKIELENMDDLTSVTILKATPEAYDTYENMPVQIFIPAYDSDASRIGETITREVIYNFPNDELAAGHIRLANGSPRKAKFKLVKISPDGAQ